MKANQSIKINILSPGRFHVCDLARELDKNGFDVKFYSFVPARRAEKFGLPRRCSKSVIGIMAPFLVIERKIFKHAQWPQRLRIAVQDYITAIYMRPCDICIAMSGSFLYAPQRAQRQGAVVILERGSKHILEQKRILDELKKMSPTTSTVPDINVRRELEGYKIADYISIASKHVKRSFLLHNYPEEKLFLNPYGVDVSMFHQITEAVKKYDVIMVGGWSYRKGCDLIVEAVRQLEISLLHVGGIVDLPFPNESNFTHVNSVDEKLLPKYYAQAKVFVLPSREEGLALVQAQAAACNLPIVCSKDSGGEDIKHLLGDTEYIEVMEDTTTECLKQHITSLLKKQKILCNESYAQDYLPKLSWLRYGTTYAQFLRGIDTMGGVKYGKRYAHFLNTITL